MDKCFYIYLIENKKNGKKYIGQRLCVNSTKDNEYLGSGKLIKRAILKYGKDSFVKTILQDNILSRTEADKKESEFIKIHKSIFPYGYNIAIGGYGGDTLTNNPNRKEIVLKLNNDKERLIKSGIVLKEYWQNPENKKKQTALRNTAEYKKNASLATKKKYENPTYRAKMLKIVQSKEYREKQRISSTNRPSSKKGLTNTQIYGNEKAKSLSKIASDRFKVLWNTPEYKRKMLLKQIKQPVIAFTCMNELYFDSISECANHLELIAQNISRCLKGKSKTSGGFSFKYANT